MNERILIAGGSIAGLTLAYWLDRYGFRPTVVERAPALRAGGNGVDVRGQATEVIERMGLLAPVRAATTDVRGMRFVDAADRTLARVEVGGPGAVEIMRGDLVAVLARATGGGVEYLFGDPVRGLAQDAAGVDVEFDRAGRRRFDLVIGADGTHSTVRRLVFGPESRYVRHRGHYFAYADTDASLGEDRCATLYNVPGKAAGVLRSGNHPQAKAMLLFRSGPLAYDHRDVAAHKRLVAAAFAGVTGWKVRELVAAALTDDEFYFDGLSQVRMDSWSAGRVALAGDAAWCASPASGAGAELALVGAYRLAGELAATGGDHRVAFARYQRGFEATVRARHRIGANVRLMVPRTSAGRWLRNTAARLPLPRPAAATPAPLPAYALTG